jgi:hypothetical protein
VAIYKGTGSVEAEMKSGLRSASFDAIQRSCSRISTARVLGMPADIPLAEQRRFEQQRTPSDTLPSQKQNRAQMKAGLAKPGNYSQLQEPPLAATAKHQKKDRRQPE